VQAEYAPDGGYIPRVMFADATGKLAPLIKNPNASPQCAPDCSAASPALRACFCGGARQAVLSQHAGAASTRVTSCRLCRYGYFYQSVAEVRAPSRCPLRLRDAGRLKGFLPSN